MLPSTCNADIRYGRALVGAALFGTIPGAAWATCPSSPDELDAALTRIERAFGDGDLETLLAAGREAERALGCLGSVITRGQAARYHRARAMVAYVELPPTDRDAGEAQVQRILAASCHEAPGDAWPEDVVALGHDLDRWLRVSALCAQVTPPVAPEPPRGAVRVDGQAPPATADPDAIVVTPWPVVWQRVDADGAVVETRWLAPGSSLPTFDAPRTPTGAWVLTGVGAGLVVGGALIAALAGPTTSHLCDTVYSSFEGCESLGFEDRQRAQRLGAGLATAGVGLGLLGGGLIWARVGPQEVQLGLRMPLP